MSSSYERIGGEPAIDAAVDKFYGKVLADDRIKHFVEDIEMNRMSSHQKKFLTFAFGGPSEYSGRSLRGAHSHLAEKLGLNDSHFDAVMENLGSTLVELGVRDNLIAEAAGIAESTRSEVLNK